MVKYLYIVLNMWSVRRLHVVSPSILETRIFWIAVAILGGGGPRHRHEAVLVLRRWTSIYLGRRVRPKRAGVRMESGRRISLDRNIRLVQSTAHVINKRLQRLPASSL